MPGRILIADDVATNRIILKVKLSAAFYHVDQAISAQAVLDRLASDRPDLVIVDQNLPDMATAELCRRIKSDPATAIIPVIVICPAGSRAERIAAFRAGADDVLVKPLDEAALLARVRSLMRARATSEELLRRQDTAVDLGFADPAAGFTRAARIALVPPNRETGFGWRTALRRLLRDHCDVLMKDQALDADSAEQPPDAYVIAADLTERGDGLRLVSELRSRAATRNAAILVILPDPGPGDTAMVLDLGANGVVPGAFDSVEVAERLRALVARKLQADQLHNSIDKGLRLAAIDPLTGLYNRRYAQTYLNRVAGEAQRTGLPFAVMILDLDRFKTVNDTYGHAAGDAVLAEIAGRLRKNLREIDLVARLGGEEFLVAMPGTTVDEARFAAERLRARVGDTPVTLHDGGPAVQITMSIGVVVSEGGTSATPVQNLIERADRALYEAKADGRDQVIVSHGAAA